MIRLNRLLLLAALLPMVSSFVAPLQSKSTLIHSHNPPSTLTNSFHPQHNLAASPLKSTSLHLRPPSLSPEASNDLLVYFLQTIINVGVPALATITVIGFAAASFGRSKDKSRFNEYMEERNLAQELYSDLYGSGSSSGGRPNLPFSLPGSNGRSRSLPRNSGIPSVQYIKITNLNTQLDSYTYSVTAATQSKASAASALRSKNFDKAVSKVMLGGKELNNRQKMDLEYVEKDFLKEGSELLLELEEIQRQSVGSVLNQHLDKLEKDDEQVGYDEDKNDVVDATIINGTSTVNSTKQENTNFLKKMMDPQKRQLKKDLEETNKIYSQLTKLELGFMKDIMSIIGVERANMVKALWIGNIVDGAGVGGSLLRGIKERPLSTLLSSESNQRKNLFVTNFPGDVSASQVNELREEVTAILRSAKVGDEALLVLQSGGGTVTGYGLAAAQLRRFKANGIKLTICVEQVAASGGYMMCCVADKVVASPFAVLGSIGVISDIPNAYERLKKEGIEFQTITAGKYKRTITPTKKPTSEDMKKSKEDIEAILDLFKGFVKENRPILDIDNVATGETWFGQDALDRNLCDEIRTKDDVILDYVDTGFEVFDVAYEPPLPSRSPLSALGVNVSGDGRRKKGILNWLVRSFVKEVKTELLGDEDFSFSDKDSYRSKRSSDRIMMRDEGESSDRIRFES